MNAFAILTSMSRDWVRAKPWVALCGIFSSFLGSLAACGLVSYLGINWIGINIAVPFIMLGEEVDRNIKARKISAAHTDCILYCINRNWA
jgi:hypothetical protein